MPDESEASRYVRLSAEGRVGEPVACLGCGYNLLALPPGGGCPECGREIMQSLREGNPRMLRARWLRRVSRGAAILSGGIIFAFAFAILVPGGSSVVIIPILLLLATVLIGTWWFTTDPGKESTVTWLTRKGIRWLNLIACAILVWGTSLPGNRGDVPLMAGIVLGSIGALLAASYVRRIAAEMGGRGLAAVSRWMTWWFGLSAAAYWASQGARYFRVLARIEFATGGSVEGIALCSQMAWAMAAVVVANWFAWECRRDADVEAKKLPGE